jgi:subtilisin family serine protease
LVPCAAFVSSQENIESPIEITHAPAILVDGLPPLICGDEICERPLREYLRDGRPAAQEYGWWNSFGPDLDWNGMDDRLQRVLDGMDSVSPTAIIGPDGKKTVAIIVNYAWHPADTEISQLQSVLNQHGWIGQENGAWFSELRSIDSLVVDKVPVSALMEIYFLEGVVVVEMQNVMVPSNDVAVKATKSKASDQYPWSVFAQGYTGEGIVIAVLDTGVDNEHRSLNDFDDLNDEPDEDANSYDDQKWFGGYDATSFNPVTNGSSDPNDGNGHGTHVAGSALGTGGSSGVHSGTAPGAGLVDIKVLTDSGGTNSQASLAGLQWMIDNRDTDWGINSDYKGIQIGSMSFGSASTPLNPGDQGNNGTSAETSLINAATEQGIVCVVAAGNDGSNRIPSPASADGAITIGSVNDKDTVDREDDEWAEYSNFGPRLDDGDDDSIDEMKPDITSYGTNIMSAQASIGFAIPGSVALADDDYEEKTGTSMATPIASGVVALMLQAAEEQEITLTPEIIRTYLRDSAEQRGKVADNAVDPKWNETYGAGIIDAACAIDLVLGRVCGNAPYSPVNVTFPSEGAWLLSGDTTRISGDANASWDFTKIEVFIEQHYPYVDVLPKKPNGDDGGDGKHDKPPVMLMNWTETRGTPDNWFLDVPIENSWVKTNDESIQIHARGLDEEGNISSKAIRKIQVSRMGISLLSPALREVLEGPVQVTGQVEGVEHDRIEYRIDEQEWMLGTTLTNRSGNGVDGLDDWEFTWDSSEAEDGSRELFVRMVNKSGLISPITSRTYNIDNIPPAPGFRFQGDIKLFDQQLPAETVYSGSLLELKFDVLNGGDKNAEDILVRLNAPGEISEVYPSQVPIPLLKKGESVEVTLWWLATVAGIHDVSIEIDPNNVQGDMNVDDNVYSFTYEILERPSQPVLRFLPGSATTIPNIPLVNEPYQIKIRVDNLGSQDAISLDVNLERKIPGDGWLPVDTESILVVPGATTTSGYSDVEFVDVHPDKGAVFYRATLSGNGVEAEYNTIEFTVAVSDIQFIGENTLSLSDDEYPVAFAGIGKSTLVFTERNGELHVRSLSSDLRLLTDTLVDNNWAGELTVFERSDGLVHAAWTSRVVNQQGSSLNDVAMTSFSETGQMLPVHHHLTPIKISEGQYWGLDITEEDGLYALSGYYRNISTSGSWSDTTSIFSIQSSTPDFKENWSSPINHLVNIDIHPDEGDSLSTVLLGGELHVLYEELRDDISGEERVGLMYARGGLSDKDWSYQLSVGDYASSPQLGILDIDEEDMIFAAWIEGEGRTAQIAHTATKGNWVEEIHRVNSPGSTKIEFSQQTNSIDVIYDEITVFSRTIRYGLLTDDGKNPAFALGNVIGNNEDLIGYSTNVQDGIVFTETETGRISMQKFALNTEPESSEPKSFIEQLLAPLPGSESTKKLIFFGILGAISLLFLIVMATLRYSHKEEEKTSVIEDADVAIMVTVENDSTNSEDELVATLSPSSTEFVIEMEEPTLLDTLEAKNASGDGSARLNRRMQRKHDREIAEIVSKNPPLPMPVPGQLNPLPLPNTPLDGEQVLPLLPPLPELPPLRREATCPSCQANFVVTDMMRSQLECPICSEKFSL